MDRSSRKLDVVAVAAAASPIVESGNQNFKKMKRIHYGTYSFVQSLVAAAAAASPDFKSGKKRGVNKLKKKAAEFKRKRNRKGRKIQEFSNEKPSSNDPTTPFAPQMQSPKLSKTVTARNIPFAIQKFEICLFFKQAGEVVNAWYDERVSKKDSEKKFEYRGCCHIEFATEEDAKKALELDGQDFGNRKIVVDRYGTSSTGASKTLIAKHLPISTTKSEVIKYFKRAGEIIDVRFSSLDHEKFSKHCHIEFATEEGAKKAAEFNGRRWLGHLLELGFAHETIRVWGFDTSIQFEQVYSSLDKLFSTCGKILSLEIPTAPYTNITLGEAFIEFYDIRNFPKALAMNGLHKLGNSTLRVEDATPCQLLVQQPGPRTKIDGRPVGPYHHSYHPCRFFPHRGWYGHGIGKRGGDILANAFITGEKTIFDDDGERRKVDKRSALRDAVRKVDKSSTLRVEDAVPLQAGKKIIYDDDCPDGRIVDKSFTLRVEDDGASIGKHDVYRTCSLPQPAYRTCSLPQPAYRTCSLPQPVWA